MKPKDQPQYPVAPIAGGDNGKPAAAVQADPYTPGGMEQVTPQREQTVTLGGTTVFDPQPIMGGYQPAEPTPQQRPAYPQNPQMPGMEAPAVAAPSTLMQPGYDKAGMATAAPKKPTFGPPVLENATPEEQAKAGLKYWQDMRENPVNQDKGWKGLVKELIQNFLYGMGKTQPGMSITDGLILGGVGAGAGFLNKGWNEQRRAEAEIPIAQQRLEYARGDRMKQEQIANQQDQIKNRQIQTNLDIDENTRKNITAEQEPFLKQWQDIDEFDTQNNPQHRQMAIEAAKRGLVLIDKQRGQKYSTQIAPDGRVVITNTSTGDYRVGNENLSKPVQITDKDLPDAMFGLYDDKEIGDKALASVGKLPEGRKVRADVAAKLPAKYRNQDGSFNEDQYWKDRANDEVSISPSELYENVPSDYEQRVAGERTKLRDSQKATRAEVAKFRAALGNSRPNANAKGKPLTTVVEVFNAILSLPPKERSTKLKEFYEQYIPNIRIQ